MLNRLRTWPSQVHPLTIVAAMLVVILAEIAVIAFMIDMRLLGWAAIVNAVWVIYMSRKAVRNA